MNMKQKPQAVEEEQIRAALDTHWRASAAGDADAEHDIYDDDAIRGYPQYFADPFEAPAWRKQWVQRTA
jgi:hypothetical protein